jgi:multiple sugar transport system ATP-binding protein
MGRAIIREPKAFLMDEPLSNLDAKLRVSMRAELSRLHERLGVTTLYVTHDQVEAMTLGQRVAVLRDGVLQQVDTPQRLFHKPKNLFVAAFIGSPSMNLVEAELTGRSVRFAGFELPLPRGSVAADRTGKAIVGIRPSALEHGGGAEHELPRIGVVPEVVEELGDETHVIFTIEAPPVSADAVLAATEASDQSEGKLFAGDERAMFTARVDGKRTVTVGDRLELAVDTGALHFFDPATGLALDAGTRTELVA